MIIVFLNYGKIDCDMDRRIYFTGFAILITLCIIIGLVVIRSRSQISANPIRTIPQDALAIVKINGPELIHQLSEESNPIWASASKLPALNIMQHNLKLLDSLSNVNADLWKLLFDDGFFISIHHTGAKKIQFLGLSKLPMELNEKEIVKVLNEFTTKRINNTVRKYEGKSIYTLSLNNNESPVNYFFTVLNNLFLISRSPILIEDAIRQSSLTYSLLDNNEFRSVISTTGKNKVGNIYINFRKYSKLFLPIVNKKFSSNISHESTFGGWAELDINLMKDLILLNGFVSKTDSINSFISTISSHEPVKIEVAEVLPYEITTLIAFGISRPDKFYEDYKNYLRENNKFADYNTNVRKLGTILNTDLESLLIELIDNELALAHTQQLDQNKGTYYIAIKSKSGSMAKKRFETLLENYQQFNKNDKVFFEYSPDNEIQWPIYKLPVNNFFGQLFGELFNVFNENYFTIIDNYIIVSDSYKALSKAIYSHILKKTLDTEDTYRDYLSNLSQKSFILFYSNLARAQSFFDHYLSDEVIKIWEKHIQVFQQTQAFGFQVGKVSNLPYGNIVIKNYSLSKGKPRTVWESLLDTSASMKPQFVINHYTKQNELVIQDLYNNLYLINQAGRILWKFNIGEPINSDIYQVDYYKNNKLQLLFSTENYLHLIDRNGNYVERYPQRLRGKSTAGMSLFDYENNKNYRIFIPCHDKKVYAYSIDGSLLSGWEFSHTDHLVHSPINHFRVGDKDYIVFGDKSRTYILDRRGHIRVDIKQQFPKSEFNNYHLNNAGAVNSSYIVTTDTTGTVCKISFDGNVQKTEIRTFSNHHFFDFNDVNADGENDYIFLDENKLEVFKTNGNQILHRDFESPVTDRPIYFHFSYSDRKLGILSSEKQQIYLVNADGSIYEGFPLTGNTLFSIGFLYPEKNRFNLIVGGRNNFLYNYTVE